MPALRHHAILALAVALVAAPALAGCLDPPREHPPGADTSAAPPVKTGYHINLRDMVVLITWRAPDGDVKLEWPSEGGRWEDRTYTVPASYDGEHGSFDFVLNFRVDGAMPVHLVYNETLERRHSFNFRFQGDPAWTDAPVDRVVDVDANASWVDAETWDASRGDVSGRFHLEFTGVCEEDCPADADEESVRVVLDGRFPKPKR